MQNFRPYDTAKLLDPQTIEVDKKDAAGSVLTNPDGTNQKETQTVTEQTIAQGPVASQEFIKEVGTNGGGFFNVNSAHPFENPNPFTNFIELLAIFAIGGGLTYTLGRMTGSQRHGWAVLAAMVVLCLAGVLTAYWAESRGNPILAGLGADQHLSATQSRRQYGRQRGALWNREAVRCLPRSLPMQVVVRSIPCTTVSRRWVVWYLS